MPSVSSGRGRRRRPVSDINVVPYIDVMLVLLVIFMVTAPMLPPGQIDVPSAGQSNAAPESLVEIRLQPGGEMRMVTRNMPRQFDRAVGKRDLAPVLRELGDPGTLAVPPGSGSWSKGPAVEPRRPAGVAATATPAAAARTNPRPGAGHPDAPVAVGAAVCRAELADQARRCGSG